MLGLVLDGSCYIFASTKLTEAKLESVMRDFANTREALLLEAPVHRYFTLFAQMGEVLVVPGSDYGECMRRLMEIWSPTGQTDPGALGAGRVELES